MRAPGSRIKFPAAILAVTPLWSLMVVACAIADTPKFDPGEKIRSFVTQIEKNHLSQRPLDDQRAVQWFDRFLDDLDPQRMYFLESDYTQSQHFRSQMLDLARLGDTRFADQVRQQYAKRVQEACGYAATFLSARQDFTVDEEFPRQYPAYATDCDQLRERWRLRIKAELLIEKAHGTASSEAGAWLAKRYRRIERQAKEMTDERLCEIYLNALAHVYDPHTAYLSEREIAACTTNIATSHYAMGLSFRERRGRWVIFNVRPAMADPRTLRRMVGWELLAIQRPDGVMCDVVEMPSYDFSQLIRSPSGALGTETEVVLELQNPATLERRTVSWVRLETF